MLSPSAALASLCASVESLQKDFVLTLPSVTTVKEAILLLSQEVSKFDGEAWFPKKIKSV